MELDNLKYLWHSLDAPAGLSANRPETAPSHSAVQALLQAKSRGPVARMRRNLVGEGILVMATYTPAILFYWIDFGGRLSVIGWLLFGLMSISGAYFFQKSRLLAKMECVDCEVRSNLERQVKILGKYIRFYLVAGTLIVPLMFLVSVLIIHWQLPWARVFIRTAGAGDWTGILFWLLALIPFTLVLYYVNTWYINRLYGQHIKKLRELLAEMQEE